VVFVLSFLFCFGVAFFRWLLGESSSRGFVRFAFNPYVLGEIDRHRPTCSEAAALPTRPRGVDGATVRWIVEGAGCYHSDASGRRPIVVAAGSDRRPSSTSRLERARRE
jgi:hypothetical protein